MYNYETMEKVAFDTKKLALLSDVTNKYTQPHALPNI